MIMTNHPVEFVLGFRASVSLYNVGQCDDTEILWTFLKMMTLLVMIMMMIMMVSYCWRWDEGLYH